MVARVGEAIKEKAVLERKREDGKDELGVERTIGRMGEGEVFLGC